jgi:hypothetical protein
MDALKQMVADRKAEYMEAKAAYGARSPWTQMAKQEYERARAALGVRS